jgi:hypothetical protein
MDKYLDSQINALNSVLIGNEPYYYRKMCRYVSRYFSISLLDVENLPIDWVLSHFYESSFEEMDNDNLVDIAKNLCAPEMVSKEEEQIQGFMKDLEQEQELVMSRVSPKELPKEEVEQSLNVEKLPEFNLNFEE